LKGIFSTYPNTTLSTFGGFFDQVVGTFILILVILALSDKKNNHLINGLGALFVGLLVTVIGLSFG